tara:strand:+ start:905 stop:1252 length:348 start_codon:yes stop_codon:yes gene_type:complete
MNILGLTEKGVSGGMPPAYNKVVKYLPNTKRRKRLSSDEREFNEKYFIVDKTDNILSLFFKIPLDYLLSIKTRKGKFRYILDVLEWRNDNKVETIYEDLVIKAVEFSNYVPKNNV